MGVDRKVKCSLKAVAQAVGFLGDEATRILKDDLKFHNMMGLDLDSLKRRDIVEIIYNRTEVVDGTIVTHISNEQRIVVTVKRIEEILGLPRGIEGEEVILPKSAHTQVLDLFLQYPDTLNKDVPSKPNFKNSLIGAKNLINLMKKVPDSKDKVRCFLMVLLNRVLIPASGFHLNERQAALAWDLECVAKTDWCKVVFDDLSDCIVNKHSDTNFSGCSLVLLIAVFEAVVPSHCPKTKPSIIGYNKKTLKTLLDLIKGMVKECGTDEEDKMGQNGSFPDYEEDIHIIMKNMADHLNDVKHMLPEEQQESIESTLEAFDALTMRIWPLDLWDPFYKANVLEVDNDSDGSHIMVQIGDHMVTKTTFRESLKPDGWMSSFVMDAQCEIWRSQWPDKIILTNYASKELLDQNGTKSLDKELNEENVNNAKQIFVPVNAERVHWILVVMDFDKHKVQILDSFASETYLVPAYKVASQLELYLMTKFNLHTGYPKERDLKLEKQKNINDCGFHVLLYIQRYGRSDMYKIDTEQILCYRKQLAYELKHESNDHPSTSTLNLDDSPLHVYSARPPPGRSTTSPSVSGSLSATESDPLGAKKQSAEEEGTSSNRLVPNEKEEGAAAHTKRKRRTEKAVGTPVVSQRPDTGAAAQLCNLLLKADPNSERDEAYAGEEEEREFQEFVTQTFSPEEQPKMPDILGPAQELAVPTERTSLEEELGSPYEPRVPAGDAEVGDEVTLGTEGEAIQESVDKTEGEGTLEPGNNVAVTRPGQDSEWKAYLSAGDWDKVVEVLERLEIVPDIYRDHPELVLLLLRQRYLDLRRSGQIVAARVYFRDQIQARYPQGTQNFVNSTILEDLRIWSRSVSVPQGNVRQERAATRQSVRHYLQLYFPGLSA